MATGHTIESKVDHQHEVAACCEKLQEDNNGIRTLDRLSGRSPKLVQDAIGIMKTLQTSRENILYQEFLGDVLHHCGRGITLLCAASLGKQRVTRMNDKDRISFVGFLKNNLSSFHHPILDTLATAYEIPSANDLAKLTGKHQYIPPYRTNLLGEDLLKFLQEHPGEYPPLAIRISKNESPSIEISWEMCQDLIVHVMECERQRIDLSSRARANV